MKTKQNNAIIFGLFLILIMVISGLSEIDLHAGELDPTSIPKYKVPLIIPPALPLTDKNVTAKKGKNVEYYEIAVRQFDQQILPAPLPETTVWSYGSVQHPGTVAEGGTFNFPALTIEATHNKPVRIKWINDLVDDDGNYLPHLLPVDQTLHWANPVGPVDTRGTAPTPYTGPVPIITHVHGAHTTEDSDGYPEAWYLPAASNLDGFITHGTLYGEFKSKAKATNGVDWEPGSAIFQYPNQQRATTLWYHDHSLGITRLNVYAGPAGFYLIRGGPDDKVHGTLPGPAPALGDKPGKKYYEIPIVIQDRSFNDDGSLAYPDNRAFFEGLAPEQLQIPFTPEEGCNGALSDVSSIWNPEFFGNTIVTNGRTWPYQEVEQRRYRLRYLNGCQSRFLILAHDIDLPFWQIGSDGGFLPKPVKLDELLLGPAERADVIVDFSKVPVGTKIVLKNYGPDDPFGGGIPDEDFDAADPDTTGQVMEFRVVKAKGKDKSTSPAKLGLPKFKPLGRASNVRKESLNEKVYNNMKIIDDFYGNVVFDCLGEVFGPTSAELGTVMPDGFSSPMLWMDPVTEDPIVGSTEIWEIYNFTADAHPIHVHLVQFQVINRQQLELDEDADEAAQPAVLIPGTKRPPEKWESGYKDTVIVYPGEVARIKAKFDIAGLYVWHCHILEHEDNEMMRPYRVVDSEVKKRNRGTSRRTRRIR